MQNQAVNNVKCDLYAVKEVPGTPGLDEVLPVITHRKMFPPVERDGAAARTVLAWLSGMFSVPVQL